MHEQYRELLQRVDFEGNEIGDAATDLGVPERPLSTSVAIRYVDASRTKPSPPHVNWATTATVIQNAVDAALLGDTVAH